MRRMTTTIPVPGQPFAIEFPGSLSQQAHAVVVEQLTTWSERRDRPLVLQEGARIRYVNPDGTLAPEHVTYTTAVTLPWTSMAVGALLGAAATLLLQAAT